MRRDTIFARATPPGRSAVAVIRVSGPGSGSALDALAGGRPLPRRAVLRTLRDPGTGEMLDRALILWMPGPGTATGEDCAELHLHGGRAVVAAVVGALAALPALRPAEAGEFARRGFLNGKLDLSAAEGLADLIDAETVAQRRLALRQAGGALGRAVEGWRETLIEARALAEASIDFADEGDVADLTEFARATAGRIAAEIAGVLAPSGRAERLREGAVIVVAGPPNAGKSSLLNRAAGRDVAIVTEIAGTTRDALEVALDLGGYPAVLIDTAGLRETADPIEAEGIRRARARIESADLVLVLSDARESDTAPQGLFTDPGCPVWRVHNKIDLVEGSVRDAHSASLRSRPECLAGIPQPPHPEQPARAGVPKEGAGGDSSASSKTFAISCRTGAGLDHLFEALRAFLRDSFAGSEDALVSHARQRLALEDAASALGAAGSAGEAELLAEELRRATDALGHVTGRVDVEDVLDAVFGRFCIGK